METGEPWHPSLLRIREVLSGSWGFGTQYCVSYKYKAAKGSPAERMLLLEDGNWPSAGRRIQLRSRVQSGY